MYNRYVPSDETYTWTRAETANGQRHGSDPAGWTANPLGRLLSGQGSQSWGGKGGLAGLLRSFHLEQVDAGDMLLLLIVLYLLVEGEDLEPVLALGLVLLLGLGED